MTSRSQIALGYFVVVVVLGLVGWGFVEAVQADPALVGSLGVAALGAGAVVWQQRDAEKARIREAHRDRMSPIYYELLGVVFKKIGKGKKPGGPDPTAEEFFRDLKARQLTLGASSEMVQAFNAWTQEAAQAQKEESDIGTAVSWEVLLRAIRKDLGHNDGDLPPYELLRLFITDFDKYFKVADIEAQ